MSQQRIPASRHPLERSRGISVATGHVDVMDFQTAGLQGFKGFGN